MTAHGNKYGSVYKLAFYASIAMLIIIPLQILIFAFYPLPKSAAEWFDLFRTNAIIGVFHADLFILINNVLIAVIYLAFYHTLKATNKGMMQIALILGFIGIAAYISSNKTFELAALAAKFSSATLESEKNIILAAGEAMLAGWQGTAFDAYYVLNGVTLLIISLLMFRSDAFSKVTASFGLASAILMAIPSTAGIVGLLFSLLSLAPWYVFTIQYSRVFLKLAQASSR